MTIQRLFTFTGGDTGAWRVIRMESMLGEALTSVKRLEVISGRLPGSQTGWHWSLYGTTSNERYVTRAEKDQLVARQPLIGRAQANCAALIPIRKTAEWWALPQDERRKIFEESSRHIQIGLNYLPAVARRLHHCRDLGENAPFDFLTWFEFAESDSNAFDELLSILRRSEEWQYIDREVDIRIVREAVD